MTKPAATAWFIETITHTISKTLRCLHDMLILHQCDDARFKLEMLEEKTKRELDIDNS
jgi:hypothetical protein